MAHSLLAVDLPNFASVRSPMTDSSIFTRIRWNHQLLGQGCTDAPEECVKYTCSYPPSIAHRRFSLIPSTTCLRSIHFSLIHPRPLICHLPTRFCVRRVIAFDACPGPIAATAFNRTGSIFAYAISYDWSKGHSGMTSGHPNKIMLHATKDDEVKKRPSKR